MPLNVVNRKHPTSVTSAFGRVFYGASNRVYFSQVFIDDPEVLGKCYQRNDPTAEELNDILPNDGGELQIQNSGNVISIVEFQLGILIFAEKGLWYLYGPESGFSATSYVLNKLSDFTVCSPRGVVNIGGAVYFASRDGMFVVAINEQGVADVVNLTEEMVNTYWSNFASSCIYPVYDRKNKQLYWFRANSREWLIYDLRFQSFYPQKFSDDLPQDLFARGAFYNGDEVIILLSEKREDRLSQVSIKAVSMNNGSFQDLGESYESYVVTVPETLGNFSRNKGTPIFSAFFKRTESTIFPVAGDIVYDRPSGCLLSAIWDWSTDDSYNRITEARSIYSPLPRRRAYAIPENVSAPVPIETGESVIQFKDKLRGTGKSVQFKFESEDNKDLQLLGYSITFSAKGRQ